MEASRERGERVADYFAACLLMPKRIIKRRFGEGLQAPEELAAEFGVSPMAMRYRLQQLGLVERTQRCGRPAGSNPTGRAYFRKAGPAKDRALIGVAV